MLNGGMYMGILVTIIVLLFGYLSYVLFNPEKF
ncbi:K(+)-transporting ATPase subunit F [Clostridium puniceum]